jgi:hypothetical protein
VHLIAGWGVKPKQDDWQQQLEASIEGFDRRRRVLLSWTIDS